MTLHIEACRWFQKTYGNTYHSVAIYRDGEQVAYIQFEYGYGEQWLQTAWEWLASNGFPELGERNANGSCKNYGYIGTAIIAFGFAYMAVQFI